ncbi:dCTP deaminase [Fulvimarina manganoxydans]|uniref:dCTP deaminase n=1 Tax=Fulvimarina manganoxydans TaxID=937218 RepID=A0A1W2EB82_9HYPH|nr:dCTP deaminase [Fulvimarina manganoxydans]SMD06672.1 dCTP deaminase [Fulvimarina manganoxydans]
MLSKSEIIKLIKKGETDPSEGIGVVPSPLSSEQAQIGPGSLDLRLGRWFLVLQQSKRSVIDLREQSNAETGDRDGKYYYVPFGAKFVIHPNRFVLGVTLEWLRMPKTVGGYILGKSSLGRRGLIIETAAGIQPGFSGCLTLELFNCGEVPISIEPGMLISQVFFHKVDGEPMLADSHHHGRRRPVFGVYRYDTKAKAQPASLI